MSTRKTPKDQAKSKQQHQQLQVPKSNGSSNNSSKVKLDKKGNSSELNKSNSSSTHHEKKPKIEVRERNQNSKKSKPKILPINLLFGLAAGSLFTTLAAADLSADLFALETNTLDFIPQYLAWRSTAPYMVSLIYHSMKLIYIDLNLIFFIKFQRQALLVTLGYHYYLLVYMVLLHKVFIYLFIYF